MTDSAPGAVMFCMFLRAFPAHDHFAVMETTKANRWQRSIDCSFVRLPNSHLQEKFDLVFSVYSITGALRVPPGMRQNSKIHHRHHHYHHYQHQFPPAAALQDEISFDDIEFGAKVGEVLFGVLFVVLLSCIHRQT